MLPNTGNEEKCEPRFILEARKNRVELMIFTLVPLEDHAEKHVFLIMRNMSELSND